MDFRLGAMHFPHSFRDAVEFARLADVGGLDVVGFPDSPFLYPDPYLLMATGISKTSRAIFAPCATNAVGRHWSVHSAVYRTLEELAPGRSLLFLATGNSALRTAGIAPHSLSDLEHALTSIRENIPSSIKIILAAGGVRTAEVAGRIADGVLLGCGTHPETLDHMLCSVEKGRGQSGGSAPFERWLQVPASLAKDEERGSVNEAADDALNAVIGFARQALAFTFQGKNVPADLADDLERFLKLYDYSSHGKTGGAQRNARLLADDPRASDLRRFFLERYAIVDEPVTFASRLRVLQKNCDLDGMMVSLVGSDPLNQLRRLIASVAR